MKYITFKEHYSHKNYVYYINVNAINEIILDSDNGTINIRTNSGEYLIKVTDGTVQDAANLILESSPEDKTTIVQIK